MSENGEGYRLRRVGGGESRGRASPKKAPLRHYFTVPRRIADQLPEDARYEVLLTTQGVLYRPINPEPEEVPPAWVTEARR